MFTLDMVLALLCTDDSVITNYYQNIYIYWGLEITTLNCFTFLLTFVLNSDLKIMQIKGIVTNITAD